MWVQGWRLLECPAGKGARGVLDVLLAVIAYAHREQLEQFSPVVLVWLAVPVLVVIQPEKHRRVAGKIVQDGRQVFHAVPAKHFDLVLRGQYVLVLHEARGEDVMPEEGHLLLELRLAVDHPIQPAGDEDRRTLAVNVTLQHLVLDIPFRVRIQERLDRVFVTAAGVTFELLAGRPESSAAVQVAEQVDICFRRMRNGSHRKTSRGLNIKLGSRRMNRPGAVIPGTVTPSAVILGVASSNGQRPVTHALLRTDV